MVNLAFYYYYNFEINDGHSQFITPISDPDEDCRPVLRSHSTPRRSVRLKHSAKIKIKTNASSGVVLAKYNKTAVLPRSQKAIIEGPKPNRTLELRKEMHRKTKTTSKNAVVMKPDFPKPVRMVLTNPKTPELIRRIKSQNKRPLAHIKSFVQRENEEVEKMKKYKFKAAPVPKTVKPRLPISDRIKSEKPTTKPVTPNLSKGRKRQRVEDEPPKEFKAQPIPSFAKPAVPVKAQKKVAEVKPFSFDKRYADPNVNKKKLIEKHLSELKKNTEFKAKPYFGSKPLVQNENKKPSQQSVRSNDFVLPGEAISKKKKAAFEKKVQEEAEKQKAKAKFKASSIRR